MDTESGMDDADMGRQRKKLLKIMKDHDGKSKFKESKGDKNE